MPHFFFNVFDGYGNLDTEGMELPDCQAAQVLAIRHAGEVLQSDAARIQPGDDWRMEVTDERGLIVFRLDFNVLASAVRGGGPPLQNARSLFDPDAL